MDEQPTKATSTSVAKEEEDERFFLTGPTEIAFALNDLIHRGERVTINFAGGAEQILTMLLEVDRRAGTLVFDRGGSDKANARLLGSPRNIFIAKPDGIKVQFLTGEVSKGGFKGREAFITDLPERVVRLQRRESFRVATPIGRPVLCHVGSVNGHPLSLPLHDISVCGVGLTLSDKAPLFDVGKRLGIVRIDLPEHGEVRCEATVRHLTQAGSVRGQPVFVVGLRFEDMPHAVQARIQRFIVDLERARRSAQPD
jgi:flagellar brake protein